ncbi:MAG: HIT family protein [Actinomycetes bacterium]
MADDSVFTMIIRGDLPGRFVWKEDDVVAFLTIGPVQPGHTLVVPVAQVDRWTDVDPATWARVTEVSRSVGQALEQAFGRARVGLVVAGLEVPHCHVHLIPMDHESDLSFAHADVSPAPEDLDAHALRIRAALRELGHDAVVPAG